MQRGVAQGEVRRRHALAHGIAQAALDAARKAVVAHGPRVIDKARAQRVEPVAKLDIFVARKTRVEATAAFQQAGRQRQTPRQAIPKGWRVAGRGQLGELLVVALGKVAFPRRAVARQSGAGRMSSAKNSPTSPEASALPRLRAAEGPPCRPCVQRSAKGQGAPARQASASS